MKQRATLELANASRHQKENLPTSTIPTRPLTTHINNAVITSEDQLLASQLRAEHFQRKLQNERRKSARGRNNVVELREELQSCRSGLHVAEGNCRMMDMAMTNTQATLARTEQLWSKTRDTLSRAQAWITTLTKTHVKLSKRVARIPEKIEKALSKPHPLKENGFFTEDTRMMTRELVKLGVPMEQVSNTVEAVAKGVGVNVKGHISTRSVGRVTLEGGLTAQLQLVHEIENVPGGLYRAYLSSNSLPTFFISTDT